MKKIYCFLIVFATSHFINAQSVEITAGGGYNMLNISRKLDFDNEELKNGPACTFSLSLDEFFSDTTPLKLSLRFTNYSGRYYYVDASPGGGSAIEYEFNDYLLGLGFYPLNFKIAKFIELNFGIQADYILHSKADGKISSWSIVNPAGTVKPLESEKGEIIVGLTGNLVFNINLSDKVYLFPLYNYYMNFRQVRSIRHQFEVGVGRRIN